MSKHKTKINLDDEHVIQNIDTQLTFNGEVKYVIHPIFTGNTQLIDAEYVTGITSVINGNVVSIVNANTELVDAKITTLDSDASGGIQPAAE